MQGVGFSYIDDTKKTPSVSGIDGDSGHVSLAMSLQSEDSDSASANSPKRDEENQLNAAAASGILRTGTGSRASGGYFRSKSRQSGGLDLGFLADLYGKRKRGKNSFANDQFNEALSIVSSGSQQISTFGSRICPWFDDHAKRQEAFVSEMRLLSSLRHPCICTVMGAVMSHNHVPMLVMGKSNTGGTKYIIACRTHI